MRFSLIDNSTLTGVQRVLGEVPIKSHAVIEGDILCLESLIRNILFYDDIYFLNDYKKEHRESREKFFNYINPISFEKIEYQHISNQAMKAKEHVFPIVKSGDMSDENFAPFLEMLKLNVNFNWKIQSSNWFLTMSMLKGHYDGNEEVQRFKKLSSIVFEALKEQEAISSSDFKSNYLLLDKNDKNVLNPGYRISTKDRGLDEVKGVKQQVSAFLASLNWLAQRTLTYLIVAENVEMSLELHPIRDSFVANYMKVTSNQPERMSDDLIEYLSSDALRYLDVLHQSPGYIASSVKIPFFTAWLASKGYKPSEFVEKAHELKQTKPFQKARQTLLEIDLLYKDYEPSKSLSKANKIMTVLKSDFNDILYKYGIDSPQGNLSSSIVNTWNAAAAFSELPKLPQLKALQAIMVKSGLDDRLPRTGLRYVFRNMVNDVSKVCQFGRLYEQITADAVLLRDDYSTYQKTEDVTYRRSKSHFKTPM